MNTENIIEVRQVSKVFSRNFKSARAQLLTILKESFLGCHNRNTLHKDEFWALKEISFSVKKNERVAILGPNGSGKSTLLKMLNGIYLPDQGSIEINGQISSVLELSSGFKPELSGLENIYLKFALLGKKKEEVDAIVDEVIAFSELEAFMETPLKHYSSGMKSKLGFAIVTNMDPEIMILDEVFAAGDQNFQKKSEARLQELYENTTTILVSHSMNVVKKVADRVIVLKEGELVFDGTPDDGIEYYEYMNSDPLGEKILKITTFVENLYKTILGRTADKEGLLYWKNNLLLNKFTCIRVVEAFILSEEFNKKNLSNKAFLSVLNNILYDEKEEYPKAHSPAFKMGKQRSKKAILNAFLHSSAFEEHCQKYTIS